MSYEIPYIVKETIEGARERQIREHGDTDSDTRNDNGTWALIAGEEFGEWCLSLLQENDDGWQNAAHVAAVMIAYMEAQIAKLAKV